MKKLNIIFLILICTLNLFAQNLINKPDNVYQETKNTILIKRVNGSFNFDLSKYKLSQKQIEDSISSFLSLTNDNKFVKIKERNDDLGFTHINYQQLYKGIPVIDALLMLHIKNGKPNSINGKIVDIKEVEITPAITSIQALKIATKYASAQKLMNTYPVQLVITQINNRKSIEPVLVYKVRIDANFSYMKNIFVNALSGKVMNAIDLIADVNVPAVANTLYSGTQSIITESYGTSYRLRDNNRKIETYDASNASESIDAVDYNNNTTSWGISPIISSLEITEVAPQGWWYNSIVDQTPDLYIIIKDGNGQIVYNGKNYYVNNTMPTITNPITFTLNISMTAPPYSLELWDYDPTGGDDYGGAYPLYTQGGDQYWNNYGNKGSCTILSASNPELDVHWGMEKTYDFYKNVFSRNSYDGQGSKIINYLNPPQLQAQYNNDPNNAFATPPPYNVMMYGLGDGVDWGPVVGLDVEGHEYTHMVIFHAGNTNGIDSGLVYQGESGALNESFADIFGTCIEFYTRPTLANWTIGENVVKTSPNYLRSMSYPEAGRQPKTYNAGFFWANPNCELPFLDSPYDHCGVHINSGVQNYWFYLLSMGGSDINDLNNNFNVTGIGIAKAQKIAYRNLTTYLPPYATYYDAYLGSLQAAQDLYGINSSEYWSVREAWYAVGIGGNNPYKYCSGTVTLNTSSGSFEDGSGSDNYLDNSNCQWLIAPTDADSIKITFTNFYTEQGYDTVFVYDGPTTDYPYHWWSGQFTNPITYSVHSDSVLIRFSSDYSNNDSGWSANYSSTSNLYTFIGFDEWSKPSNWSNKRVPPSPCNKGTIVIDPDPQLDQYTGRGICSLDFQQTISYPATILIKSGKILILKEDLKIR